MRLISLTTNLCKFFEQMALGRITWVVLTTDLPVQHETGSLFHLFVQDNLAISFHDIK